MFCPLLKFGKLDLSSFKFETLDILSSFKIEMVKVLSCVSIQSICCLLFKSGRLGFD